MGNKALLASYQGGVASSMLAVAEHPSASADVAPKVSTVSAGPSSVAKAASLLLALAHSNGGQGRVSDLAESVGMPKSTAHRLLSELQEEGLVGRSGARYRLGPAWYVLCETARLTEYDEMRDVAAGPLEQLFESRRATVHLAVLDDLAVFYVEKLTGSGGCRVPTRVGSRNPATCTALGKVLLAFSAPDVVARLLAQPLPRLANRSITARNLLLGELVEARRRGVARESGEARDGVACVAAPILVGNRVVAAVSVSRTSDKLPSDADAAAVRVAAARIGSLLVERS
jgi:DNA-binding IclR family transcriptional regulator